MSENPSIRAIHTFSYATIIFWLSFLIYLPPFVHTPEIKNLVDESYEFYRMDHPDISKHELENNLYRSLYFSYAKSFFYIFLGILSGILIYRQKNIGMYLAIIICILMLSTRAIFLLKSYPNIQSRLHTIYVLLLKNHPASIIHKDIVAPIFYIFSIFFLFKSTLGKKKT